MGLRDSLHDRQTEPGAGGLGREERSEHLVLKVLRYSRPGIPDEQLQQFAARLRSDVQAAATRHRLDGVFEKVDEQLANQPAVHADAVGRWRELQAHSDVSPREVYGLKGLLDDLGNGLRRETRLAG